MFRIGLLFILICSISACKQEDVGFNSVEQNPHSLASTNPGTDNPGGGDDDDLPVRPPVVRVTKAPQDHFLGEETEFGFEIVEGDFPVVEIECSINGKPIDCDLGSSEIPLVDFPLGDHKVKVVVVDESGLKARAKEGWRVGRELLRKTTEIKVEIEEKKADILFVVDNSLSMHEEQEEVARRISNFFNQIKRLNWRVGIITTDPYRVEPKGGAIDPYADGVLLEFPNGKYYLDSNLSLGQAKKLFAETIYRPEQGNGHERGIRNTFRSIERYRSSNNSVENKRLRSFYRSDAALSVVLISDENETLTDGIGRPLGELDKSKGENLVKYVEKAWGKEKKFQFNSIVVRTGDYSCIGENESFGTAYENTSLLTGGVVENICANDYTGVLSKIGSGVANLQKVYDLSCQPQDKDNDGIIDVSVKTSGPLVPAFQLSGNKIEFDQPLEEGQYQVVYYCF